MASPGPADLYSIGRARGETTKLEWVVDWGATALHYAASKGNLAIATWLLDHGADVKIYMSTRAVRVRPRHPVKALDPLAALAGAIGRASGSLLSGALRQADLRSRAC
jgi:ankyrin repeat protein